MGFTASLPCRCGQVGVSALSSRVALQGAAYSVSRAPAPRLCHCTGGVEVRAQLARPGRCQQTPGDSTICAQICHLGLEQEQERQRLLLNSRTLFKKKQKSYLGWGEKMCVFQQLVDFRWEKSFGLKHFKSLTALTSFQVSHIRRGIREWGKVCETQGRHLRKKS